MRTRFETIACRVALVTASALLTCLPCLTSCETSAAGSAEAFYSARVRKQEDRLERVPNPAGFTFLITCPSGIGGATLCLQGGRWPEDLRVRLRYAEGKPFTRIEGFTVMAGRGKPVAVRSVEFHPEWAEVRLPVDLVPRSADTLTLEWVDQYRR